MNSENEKELYQICVDVLCELLLVYSLDFRLDRIEGYYEESSKTTFVILDLLTRDQLTQRWQFGFDSRALSSPTRLSVRSAVRYWMEKNVRNAIRFHPEWLVDLDKPIFNVARSAGLSKQVFLQEFKLELHPQVSNCQVAFAGLKSTVDLQVDIPTRLCHDTPENLYELFDLFIRKFNQSQLQVIKTKKE